MIELLDHLNEVSVFGSSVLALFLILGTNFIFSLLHTVDEWIGSEVPIWRNFGAIVGVWIPDWPGFLGFTLLLTIALWIIGLMGIAGWLPIFGPVPTFFAIGALGALVGTRVSDTLVSHVLLYSLKYRPNPGLLSTPLYVVEAIFIVVAFDKGLSIEPSAAWVGFAGGFLFFCIVLPSLWLLQFLMPTWRRPRWISGTSFPEWTKHSPNSN